MVAAQGPGITAVFGYDVFNRRVSKTVNGVTTRFIYLGVDLAAETNASWSVTASYFCQPGVDQPISRTAGGTTVYYLQDHAGSVSALANASGSILGRYRYSPWGEIVSQDAGLPAQPLKWTGRELDETGLYYLRGRYYVPQLGRFISEDPAGLAANLNLYAFALNSPVGMRDPFGLDASNLNVGGGFNWLDGLQMGLDLAGLIPGLGEIADGANGLISLGRGNYGDAALSFGAMIPFAGAAATAGKFYNKAANITPKNLYAFGNLQAPRAPRAGKDVFPDNNDVIPAQSPPLPNGASTFADPKESGLNGYSWELPAGTPLSDGLGVVADGQDVLPSSPHNKTHHTIYPTRDMPMAEFTEKFGGLPWSNPEKR